MINRIKILAFFCLLSFPLLLQAQSDQQAMDILDKAMGPVGSEEGNMAIYFESIAFGVQKPQDVFSLPAYKVYKGGFFIQDSMKYEIQIGLMKALSDGKLMVVIDEQSKTMVVDSVREQKIKEGEGMEQMPDVEKLMDKYFGEANMKYQGKETINGKECHKIKAEYEKDKDAHVYYYVQTDNNKLLLIAEWQGEAYDVYQIKKITKAPKGYDYSVNLPKKELETFYGYQVFDFRYISEGLKMEN